MASVVLDAFAILAHLPANVCDVIKALLRRGLSLKIALRWRDAVRLDLRPHGYQEAIAAPGRSRATRQYSCGMDDRTFMVLVIAEGLPAITAARAWGKVEVAGLITERIRQ